MGACLRFLLEQKHRVRGKTGLIAVGRCRAHDATSHDDEVQHDGKIAPSGAPVSPKRAVPQPGSELRSKWERPTRGGVGPRKLWHAPTCEPMMQRTVRNSMQATKGFMKGLAQLVAVALTLVASASGGTLAVQEDTVPQASEPWPRDYGSFSYTYLQASFGQVTTTANQDFDRIAGRLSVGLSRHIYVSGILAQSDADTNNDSVQRTRLALGAHLSLSPEVDLFTDLGYHMQTNEVLGLQVDSDGPTAALGLRGISPSHRFEAEARYSHSWLSIDGGSHRNLGNIRFECLWRATDRLALVVGGDWEKTLDSQDTIAALSIGLRASL